MTLPDQPTGGAMDWAIEASLAYLGWLPLIALAATIKWWWDKGH